MSNLTTTDALPEALYLHCVKVYELMLSEASVRMSEDTDDQIVVWEGMLTALITGKLHLSVPYYTSVTRALKRMHCVRQLKRGGGTAASQWELIREPTIELFDESKPLKVKRTDRYGLMQEQLNNHNKRLLQLEKALQRLIDEETSDG